jgi:octaprenyl-diphosphate synthase
MEAYLKRINNKTASLFATAAESGAVVSGASESIVSRMREYGYNVGMAHQIVDDILDLDGDSEEFGKPVGQDLAHGILTLPSIIALERGTEESPILDYFRNPEDQRALSQAVSAASDGSIIEESYSIARDYGRTAVDSLAGLERNACADSLELLVEHVLTRRS